jgi:RNA recognition motif-containing protein
MRNAGDVVRVDVAIEPSGRSKGYALVEYASPEDAVNAINTLTDTEVDGRLIFVREDREQSVQPALHEVPHAHGGGGGGGVSGGQQCRVFVGNLDWQVGWQEVKDAMRAVGDVVRAEVLYEPSGRSKVGPARLAHLAPWPGC